MPFVIGTAGHIDHGKTALVKALTGQDTDRLKEEKERGISIDLGFAHLDLPDGTRAGVIDVPGHERFIRNMLAGAHGIDLVLFTVAADDGVMPQTEEHFDIVHLLGVRRAIFVISKADLATPARLGEVEEEIGILAAGTPLEGSPVAHVSSVTGDGLEGLRSLIADASRNVRDSHQPGYFRLPVDRAFALQGHGLVVTGTALGGVVRSGDRVRCLPGGQILRVRHLQVHDETVEIAQGGQRVALNLTGQEIPTIERGHVICDEALSETTDRYDGWLEVRPTAKAGIRNHQRVRVHTGTAERLGTLILLGGAARVAPNESGFCQITLSEPVMLMRGDRFIVRDETAQRTIGGGVVIDPWARKHKRREVDLLVRLHLLRDGSPAEVLRRVIGESASFAVSLGPLHLFVNLPEGDVQTCLDGIQDLMVFSLEGETLYTTDDKWQRLKERLLEALGGFHAGHPLSPGMEMEAARDQVCGDVPPRLFRAVVDRLDAEKAIARDGSLLRLPTHSVRLQEGDRALADRIRALLSKTPLAPPDLKQLEAECAAGRGRVVEMLRVLERERSIVRVSPELYFLREALDSMKATLLERATGNAEVTPAMFRDLFGTSRKYAIPLLEFLDREGVTVRAGDSRRMRA